MELELGVKLARVADDFTSANFQIAKDRVGPLFVSKEKDTLFILTAYLKGYKKRNIKIEISKDGTKIVIRGEKAIQETVIVVWKLYKKEIEIKKFRKTFKIPNGVILDKIRAKFDEDESTLTISMPKQEKGLQGFIVEEVKEQEQLPKGGSVTFQVAVDHKFLPEQASEEGTSRENETKYPSGNGFTETEGKSFELPEIAHDHEVTKERRIDSNEILRDKLQDLKGKAEVNDQPSNIGMIIGTKYQPDEVNERPEDASLTSTARTRVPESLIHEHGEPEKERINQETQGNMKTERDDHSGNNDLVHGSTEDDVESSSSSSSAVLKPPEGLSEHRSSRDGESREDEDKGKFRICTPIVAGSALLLSLVVFVIHFLRTTSQPGRKKD